MGDASKKSATMLVLVLTAALLPILIQLLDTMQQAIKQRKKEEAEREALTVAVASLRIRRHLDGGCNPQDGEGAPKRCCQSHYQHDRATQAVEQDYFCLTPVFDDKQFEHLYRITKTMAQQLLNVCALTDPFFTAQTDVCKRFNIGPMVKVLMFLKTIGYGCSPSAFLNYF
jgi:hypothetical protein